MSRRVFYSFHYQKDNWRVQQIRNMGKITFEGDVELPTPNDWERVLRQGDNEVKKWIDEQLKGRSCTIVLIGEKTASRKWVKYEIKRSWEMGKGLIGIYIHNLKDSDKKRSKKGDNPFGILNGINIPTYDPRDYLDIQNNIEKWVEEGIQNRENYKRGQSPVQRNRC